MQLAANGRWLDGGIIALLLAAGILVQTGAVAKPSAPDGSRAVAVLFAPWVDAGSALQRVGDAGARIVGQGAFPFIVVVEPDRPDFAARAAAHGAVLILDPRALAACFTLGRP
jgi:hypothetical protein